MGGFWILPLALTVCCGCAGGEACAEVAGLLRQCCAKGAPELRANCERAAQNVEESGDGDKCERALETDEYGRCAQ